MVHYLTKGSSSENGISSFQGFAMALAILYALAAVVAFGLTGPTVQSYNIADSARNAFHIPPLVTGIVIAILFAIIVVGGAKRIGSFASYIVPFIAGVYIVLMVIILGGQISREFPPCSVSSSAAPSIRKLRSVQSSAQPSCGA